MNAISYDKLGVGVLRDPVQFIRSLRTRGPDHASSSMQSRSAPAVKIIDQLPPWFHIIYSSFSPSCWHLFNAMAVPNGFPGSLTADSTFFTIAAVVLASLLIVTASLQAYAGTLGERLRRLELWPSGVCVVAAILFLIFVLLRNSR